MGRMLTRRTFLLSLGGTAFALSGCRRSNPVSRPLMAPTTIIDPRIAATSRTVTPFPMRFTDVSASAGLHWQYTNGATGHNFFIEQTGGGVAFLDYNNDGWLDIFAVQSGAIPGDTPHDPPLPSRCALYRNNGDGTFTDVTTQSGLDFDMGYGQGVSVADYDNDGWPDLYVTSYGGNHLLHNNGDGTFTNVTTQAGLGDTTLPGLPDSPTWATGSAWGDYDNDGLLDLYVCHYCRWTMVIDKSDTMRLQNHNNPFPGFFQPTHSRLYHNNGDGTFTDVTEHAGLAKLQGKSLSAAWIDYDDDGWMDLFVTNDTTPDFLLHNNRDGTFTDKAVAAGVAYDATGTATASMGIGLLDYRNEGREDIIVTNFGEQYKSVRHNMGHGLFQDAIHQTKIANANRHFLGFGVECLDYDLDGYQDIIVGNGHVVADIAELSSTGETYAQSQQLLHNQGDGTFLEDLHSLGDLVVPRVTRGLAIGDYDNDGDVDVVMVSQTGPLQLYRNDGGNQNHWITLRLEGVQSNRDAVGARVTIHTQHGPQTQWVKGGSSYCSHSDQRLTFGMGQETAIRSLEIRWPHGLRQIFTTLSGNHFYWIREGHLPVLDPRLQMPWEKK